MSSSKPKVRKRNTGIRLIKVQYVFRENTKVGRTPMNNNRHLSNEGQECKTGHVKRRVIVRGG
jgi:hypothetical protein